MMAVAKRVAQDPQTPAPPDDLQASEPVPGLLVRDGSYVIEHGDFVRVTDEEEQA